MKEIIADSKTFGRHVIKVDDSDYEMLASHHWHVKKINNTYYAITGIKKEQFYMHRMVLKPKDKNIFIDHKDRDGLNNQRDNLRQTTRSQNSINRQHSKNTASKYMGVCWNKREKKWTARVMKEGKRHHLGRYDDETEAAIAYNNAAIQLHGEFSNVNNILCGG